MKSLIAPMWFASFLENNKVSRTRRVPTLLLVIVCAGVLARAYRINAPLFERHGGRQYDTAAIARNFAEGSMNMLYPQIDWRGNSPGYVETEFQIYTYLVAVLYRLFGQHEWMGRAVNIAVYVFSALLLFHLTRRLFDDRVALFSVLFYAFVPLSFQYTRTFQPDAMMAFFSLAGVYYFWRWTETDRWKFFALSAFGISLAILVKPTSFYLGLPLLYLCHRRFGWKLFGKATLWLYALVVLLPAALWYHHAAALWATYGNSMFRFFMAQGSLYWTDEKAWLLLGPALGERLVKYVATPAGLLLLAMGLGAQPSQRNYLLYWWAAGFGVSVLLAARNYWGHDYYLLPFVFLTAAWMGCGAARLWETRRIPQRISRPAVVALCLAVVGLTFWRMRDWTAPREQQRIEFAQHLNRLTEPDALVIDVNPHPGNWRPQFFEHRTADGEYLWGFPVHLYLSHRKGWTPNDIEASPEFVEKLRQRGARYLATFSPEIFERHPELKAVLDRCQTPLEVTPRWAIYRLSKPCSEQAAPPVNPALCPRC